VHSFNNVFISSLEKADQISLLKGSRTITLTAGDVLSSPHQNSSYIYFPTSGSIALFLGLNESSRSTQGLAVGLIGSEGAAGLELALGFRRTPFQLIVQSSGQAYAVEAKIAQKLIQRHPKALLKFSRQLWSLFEGIANFSAKAYAKDIKIRLAYWILLSSARCAPAPLLLTHLQIAKMLGVRRSSISIAARDLKLKLYISYSRGHVAIINKEALELLSNN
jgi:CRP-like cAMP-binding protein